MILFALRQLQMFRYAHTTAERGRIMAKQFSILTTNADLGQLQDVLHALGDIDILSDVTSDDLKDLRPLDDLEIPLSSVGKVSLFCYLAPRHLPRKIVAERDSPVKVHIDVSQSHLIQFWRPYYDTRVFRRGRLYYQNKVAHMGTSVDKDQAFCRWADAVMSKVRKALKLDKELGAYVGAYAAAEIASGRVTVIN
jgi:hypothetical protein